MRTCYTHNNKRFLATFLIEPKSNRRRGEFVSRRIMPNLLGGGVMIFNPLVFLSLFYLLILLFIGGIKNSLGALALAVTLVVFGKHLLWDTVQEFLGEDTEQ